MANLSAYFVTPTLSMRQHTTLDPFGKDYFVDTFLGDGAYEEEVGTYFYFLYHDTMPDALRNAYERHPLYVTQYSPEEGVVMYKFKVPEEYKETVMKPFLRGKYSEVDRDYVESNFSKSPASPHYWNRLILDKADDVRNWQEERIGVELPPDAEVWDKPKLENEVYRYNTKLFDPEANPTPTA